MKKEKTESIVLYQTTDHPVSVKNTESITAKYGNDIMFAGQSIAGAQQYRRIEPRLGQFECVQRQCG